MKIKDYENVRQKLIRCILDYLAQFIAYVLVNAHKSVSPYLLRMAYLKERLLPSAQRF